MHMSPEANCYDISRYGVKVDDHRRAIGQQGGIEALFLSAGNAIIRTTSKQQSEKTTPISVQRSAYMYIHLHTRMHTYVTHMSHICVHMHI